MTDKDKADQHTHYERLKQRYLVWYEGPLGGLFSIDVDHFIERARENRDLFIEDGYPARIIKLSVVDGQPVAEWADGS